MIPQPKGHGYISPIITDTDYFRGVNSKLAGESIKDDGDWRGFLPLAEHQAPTYETNGCSHFGTWNAVETNYKFLLGGELNASDRLTLAAAKSIGILDPERGGTPKDAVEYIRKNWSVFEREFPASAAKSLEEFYAVPSKELLQLAKNRLKEMGYLVKYEYIPNPTVPKIKEALKSGPVCFSNALLQLPDGRWYKPDGWRDTHWAQAVYVYDDLLMRDSYPPYDKPIRGDFIPEVALRYQLNPEVALSIKALLKAIREYLGL